MKPLFNVQSVMFASIFTFRSATRRSYTDDGTSAQAKTTPRQSVVKGDRKTHMSLEGGKDQI